MLLTLLLPAWLGVQPPPAAPPPPVRRIVLVVGANDGGPGRARLRYAESDADAVAEVMRDLGGVRLSDTMTLDDPSAKELQEALVEIADEIGTITDSVQFVFYYSGHSDEEGLLLGAQRMRYKELRQLIDDIDADVRIAILDSCASGAFTRLKGGTKQAPFMVAPASDVRGHAFLTSSSEDEAAQESDRVGGSFFTHYLTTGLRGAADRDGDRRVTLTEAYDFAFDETLARTELTQGGPQHAAYEIQLSGSGDLIMTDLRSTGGTLELTQEIGGRVSIRDHTGNLAAELVKKAGAEPVTLALEPGEYQVTVDDDGVLWAAELEVETGEPAFLTAAALRSVTPEATVERGTVDEVEETDPDELVFSFFDIGLVPALSLNSRHRGRRMRNVITMGFVWTQVARVDGMSLAVGMSMVDESLHGVQWSIGGNVSRGEAVGVQMSTVFNYARNLRGAQLAFGNHAQALQGGQIGVVNSATELRGGQIGVFNYGGRVGGAQLGVFNVARDADAQIGLFSVTKEGNVHPEIWTSDTAELNVSLRFPARFTYSMLTGGIAASTPGHKAWQFGLGFGGHIPLPAKFFVDIDVTTSIVAEGLHFDKSFGAMVALRFLVGWAPRPRIAVFAGPTGVAFGDNFTRTADVGRPGYGWVSADTGADRSPRVRAWPGFAGGLRF